MPYLRDDKSPGGVKIHGTKEAFRTARGDVNGPAKAALRETFGPNQLIIKLHFISVWHNQRHLDVS